MPRAKAPVGTLRQPYNSHREMVAVREHPVHRGQSWMPSARQVACSALSLVILTNLFMLGMFTYFYYSEEYRACVGLKQSAMAISYSEVCQNATLREYARTYNQVDCLKSESQLKMHPRTCALISLTSKVYAHLNDRMVQQIVHSAGDIWNVITSSIALLMIYPSLGLAMWYYSMQAREKTKRHGMELQARDRGMRRQNELLEESMRTNEKYMALVDRSQRGLRLHQKATPYVEEEFESVSESEEVGEVGDLDGSSEDDGLLTQGHAPVIGQRAVYERQTRGNNSSSGQGDQIYE